MVHFPRIADLIHAVTSIVFRESFVPSFAPCLDLATVFLQHNYIYIFHPAPWMLYLFCLGIIKGPWWAHIDGDTKYSWTEKAKTDGWLYGIWCRCLFEMSSHRFYVDIVVVVVVLVVVATIDSIVIIIILATIKLNESTKKGEPNSEVHFILFRTAETREIKNDGKNNRFAREQKPGNNLCPLFRIGCCDATAVDGTPLSPE